MSMPLPGAPYRRAYVEISNICNLKCSFCPPVARDRQVMTAAAFASLAPALAGLVGEVCLHLMGEPLNHPQLAEILQICAAHSLPVNLTTNGMLLTDARRALVLHPIVRQINLSMHSFEANFPAGNAAAYCERVFKLTRAASAIRPDLYINLRLWDQTDPAELTAPAEPTEHPGGVTLSAANAAVRTAIEAEFGSPVHIARRDLRQRKNHHLRGRIYLHFDSRFTWPAASLPVRSETGFCHGLGSHFGIHADGTVVPCCLDKEARIALGNCHTTPLAAVLSNDRAERMRAGFARGELVEDLCRRCPFISRFDGKARRLKMTQARPKRAQTRFTNS